MLRSCKVHYSPMNELMDCVDEVRFERGNRFNKYAAGQASKCYQVLGHLQPPTTLPQPPWLKSYMIGANDIAESLLQAPTQSHGPVLSIP